MAADCVHIHGKEYRVEVDMLVLDTYLRYQGETDLAKVSVGRPMDTALLIFLALTEGATLDGVELDLQPEDLTRMRRPEFNALVDEFTPIFVSQVSPDTGETEDVSKKKARTERPSR